MLSDDPLSLIFRSNSLGTVGNYAPAVLAKIPSKDSLQVAQIFLRATLDEIVKIRQLSKFLNEDNQDLIRETRDQYFGLERQMAELKLLEQRSWLYKHIFKRGTLNRARRTFVSDAVGLWNSTSTKSNAMKKDYIITPTVDLAAVESGSVQNDQPISGLVLDLPKGPVTQEAVAFAEELIATLAAGNPSADPNPSGLSPVGQSSSANTIAETAASSFQCSSPSPRSSASSANIFSSTNINVIVVNNTNSTTSGLAINNANSGSGDYPSVDSPPNAK